MTFIRKSSTLQASISIMYTFNIHIKTGGMQHALVESTFSTVMFAIQQFYKNHTYMRRRDDSVTSVAAN